MNIAVLFDERPVPYGGYTPHLVLRRVFETGSLQSSDRLLLIRKGSVLLAGHKDPHSVAERAFFSDLWRLGDPERLRTAYRESVVYAWYVTNVTRETAVELHQAISPDPAYLGMHLVDLMIAEHRAIYRRMALGFRVHGRRCWMFYSKVESLPEFDIDAQDLETFELLADAGFDEVTWEDIGLRDSSWDEYDTTDHFERLEALRRLLSTHLGSPDRADELLLLLEDLSPRLGATLGTAARAYRDARSEEDLAQAAFSARRYLNQLADAVFPPRAEKFNGRQVTRDKVKNRLFAYLQESLEEAGLPDAQQELETRGREVNRLYSEVSDLLHGTPDQTRVRRAICDLAVLTIRLLMISPERNRDPISAYATRLFEGLRSVMREHDA